VKEYPTEYKDSV